MSRRLRCPSAGSRRRIHRLTFRVEGGTRLIDWDQELIARGGAMTFGDSKDAGLITRMPTSMAVAPKKAGTLSPAPASPTKTLGTSAPRGWGCPGLVEGETLVLRHRFVSPNGDEKAANIVAAYERYAKSPALVGPGSFKSVR